MEWPGSVLGQSEVNLQTIQKSTKMGDKSLHPTKLSFNNTPYFKGPDRKTPEASYLKFERFNSPPPLFEFIVSPTVKDICVKTKQVITILDLQ